MKRKNGETKMKLSVTLNWWTIVIVQHYIHRNENAIFWKTRYTKEDDIKIIKK